MKLTNAQKQDADNFLKRLEYYRSEDRHECSLVGHRMNWLTTCQSFLIAAFVIVHGSQVIVLRLGFSILLPIIGIYVARKIYLAVSEADKVINYWHRKEREWYEEVCRIQDSILQAYLLTFWGSRWTKKDTLTPESDEIHDKSFEFQRKFQSKLVWTWSILLLLGLIINVYVAYRLGTFDAVFGIPKFPIGP